MGLLDFIVSAILILLVVRFFLADYTYYGFGPFLQTVYQITDFFCKPLRSLLGSSSPRIERAIPLIAVGLILVIRGLWFAGADLTGDKPVAAVAVYAISLSCLRFVNLLYLALIALLLSSVLLAKGGVVFLSSAGYQAFQQSTFRIFQVTQGFFRTHDLWRLFAGSALWLAAAHFVVSSILSLGMFGGYTRLFRGEAVFQIQTAGTILQIYYFVLLVAIIISWVNPDPYHPVVAVVRALAEPYLRLFRSLCPWARVGMIDFSPILAFFALFFAQGILFNLGHSISAA